MKHSFKQFITAATVLLFGLGTWNLKIGTWNLELGNCSAQSVNKEQAVPYTLEDRDRAVRMETLMNVRFESLQKEMNTRFESQQRQIDDIKESIRDLKNLFYWGFGILFTFMAFIFGYIVWDRKTVTEPIRERTQSLMQTLREYAKEQPKLADILRSHGLL